jgi:dTDP-glucose pyrophosphorylase
MPADMKKWQDTRLLASGSLADALATIERSGLGICMVVDDGEKLLGIATDGDIRRAMLAGSALDAPITTAMNAAPRAAHADTSRVELLGMMRASGVHHLPIVRDGALTGLVTIDELIGATHRPNWVVVMAGGEGKRLRPLTDDLPKPLITVGGHPILHWTVSSLAAQGFVEIFVSVNYRAEMIREYLGDGARWGVTIRYLEETEPLGTAGSLSLLPSHPSDPILVMNGDILTDVDFTALLDHHRAETADVSVAVRDHVTPIPFGVIEVGDENKVVGIREKPEISHLISAGIYAMSPSAIHLIPSRTRVDMTDLLHSALQAGLVVSPCRLDEDWIDVGRHEELEAARARFS